MYLNHINCWTFFSSNSTCQMEHIMTLPEKINSDCDCVCICVRVRVLLMRIRSILNFDLWLSDINPRSTNYPTSCMQLVFLGFFHVYSIPAILCLLHYIFQHLLQKKKKTNFLCTCAHLYASSNNNIILNQSHFMMMLNRWWIMFSI